MMLDVLDLFSGIGGFSLGLERTGGFRTAAFCEIDPFARRVLAKHWPKVPCYDDVRTISGQRLRDDGINVDVICGGFPCQDISSAGRGAGLAGERSGLWFEYARLIGELRPNYVIVENVAALLHRGLETVLGCLAALGYDAEWHCVPASAIGAPHRRDRIWIIAYPDQTGPFPGAQAGIYRREKGAGAWNGKLERSDWWAAEPELVRVVHGVPNRVDRIGCLGNAVVPQIPEMIGRAILEFDSTTKSA